MKTYFTNCWCTNSKIPYIWRLLHAHSLIWVQTSLCFRRKWLNERQKTAKIDYFAITCQNHLNRDISRTMQSREKKKTPWQSSRRCANFDVLHDHIKPFFKIDLFWRPSWILGLLRKKSDRHYISIFFNMSSDSFVKILVLLTPNEKIVCIHVQICLTITQEPMSKSLQEQYLENWST